MRGQTSHAERTVAALAAFGLSIAAIAYTSIAIGGRFGAYGAATLGYLAWKLALSSKYRPIANDFQFDGTVAVVVPAYNEDPEAFRQCLQSLLDQSRRVDEIWVIDDGSERAGVTSIAESFCDPRIKAHRMPQNVGKRHAQAWAFRRSTADVFITVDSDTVLHVDAVRNGLESFADHDVQAVTGQVRALNATRNVLTRLIDLRYANAFLYERAAYSTVRSVLCCCGSLSFFRRDVIVANLDDYVNQTFLGVPVAYGDDRRLTNYALLRGAVVLQDTAVAYTAVPERMSHFLRQQARWNKSFFRESLWVLRTFSRRKWAWWLTFSEMAIWIVFSFALVWVLALRPITTGIVIGLHYVVYLGFMAYARSVRYLGAAPGVTRVQQLATFALAPLYAGMHLVLLIPLRMWSLSTLRQGGWGTRASVEVYVDALVGAREDEMVLGGRRAGISTRFGE